MVLSININPGAAVNGGAGIGIMTPAGNPWSVPDALAQELVNRQVANPVNWPPVLPSSLTAAQVAALSSITAPNSAWRSEALVKLIAYAPSWGKSSGLSAIDYTTSVKQEMEAGFTAVRFLRLNRGNVTLTTGKALTFTTETMAYDTNANMAFPRIGGTTYGALAGATDLNGFRAVTWAGAATIPSLAAGTDTISGTLSDWIPLSDTPRAVGDGGTRPILGWRLEHLGATNGNWAYNNISANIRTPIASMRGRTAVAAKYLPGGAIDDPSTARGFVTDVITMDIYPIVRFKVPVFSVWGVGDSITGCAVITTDMQSAWGHKACCDVSTPAAPVVWANLGVAGVASSDFWTGAKALLAMGVPPPSMLVLNAASINEYGSTPDVRKAEFVLAIAADAVAVCKQYAIPHLVLWGTMINENIATAILDQVRINANGALQQYANAVRVWWLDTSGMDNGASPQKWNPAYKYDAFHPNETAQEAFFVPRLSAIIRQAAGL